MIPLFEQVSIKERVYEKLLQDYNQVIAQKQRLSMFQIKKHATLEIKKRTLEEAMKLLKGAKAN
ncbi:MAG: hypothetical protein ACTSYG_07245 [Candidatus Heimdallarchaeota archaeon]